MKIGIDLDNIVLDTFPSFLKYHNENYGTTFSLKDITNYHIWEIGIGRNREEAVGYMSDFFESVEDIPFVEGAEESIQKLMNENKIYFITSRAGSHKFGAIKFIRDKYPDLTDRLIFSGDFSGNGKSKAEICQGLGIKSYVEDHYDFLLPFKEKGINSLLLKYPWNAIHWDRLRKLNLNGDSLIVPVENWNEILEKLSGGFLK